jgi:ABC-type transport system substrate-binding protein
MGANTSFTTTGKLSPRRAHGRLAIATVDQEERKKIYADLQTYLHDELPVIPIYHPAMIAAAAKNVQGFAIDGKGFYHFETTTVSE